MNKTGNLIYFSVMVIRCIWTFQNAYAYARLQIPLSLNYKGKYTSNIKNFEIVFPQRVNKDGSFISHIVQHRHSKRSTNEIEYIFYKIPIGGQDYLVELTPNRKLIAPGAVVEIRREDLRKSLKREFLNEINPNETFQKIFKNLEIKKLENTECHFSGNVKGENVSRAAISTCFGLAGFIQLKEGFYTIEPVAEYDPFVKNLHPHILYKEDGLENPYMCHPIKEMAKALLDKVVRKRRESYIELSAPMFAETLIVLDKTMVNYHKNLDSENYILTVFNMAFNLFRDASVGMLMTLTIVRIICLEIEDDQLNLKVNANAEKTLRNFQTWQYEINPGDDTHPNHHDIALLLTRHKVSYSPESCGILGLTTIGKACDPKQSAALCEDSGLRLGYVIAHEIGHLLGADHDVVNSACDGTGANGLKTVMHPFISSECKTWSKCSQAYFKQFFKTARNCFLDQPEEHHFNMQDLLPGVMYDANFQCKYLFTRKSRECDMESTCSSLNCYIPGYACIVTHVPPADGTRCGESMWCHNSKCLGVGERPGAIDGNWGEWSAWSECTRTCGSGVASSVRNCNRPQPAHGGKNCAGERKRYKICATTITTVPPNISDLLRFISEEVNVSFVGKPCETGRPSFRDIQCGEFNDWIYPEDGKIHSWKAHYSHEDNPCVLFCINEEKAVVALRPRVVDGTMCYRGIRDICIAGTCMSLPCDLQLGSKAVEDACGVCHGDGTGCEFSQGVQTLSKLPKGLTKLVNIPAGTKNIRVEEMSPTLAKIVVRDKDTKEVYVWGKTLGVFNVPGSQAWLGVTKKNQQALHIPGPVSKPLSVWIHRLDNVSVKWSMALPAEQQRKPEFVWDFLKWGPCSAECGPGIQKSDPSCMEEKAGLVEDSYCADLQMPASKVRSCEIAKCISRWMVGDWKYCDKSNLQKKEKKRAVYCIKQIGEGEGQSQIVADSDCKDPKPHSTEPCEIRKKRENSEYNSWENGSRFKSDSSNHVLLKKYDNYLKHFSAVSVPQNRSETIPLHQVSFPRFRHYFYFLETPEDSDSDWEEIDDLDVNSADNISDKMQSKVLSTFSGHKTDISHSACKLSAKKRKSLFLRYEKGINKRKQTIDDGTARRIFEKKRKNCHDREKKCDSSRRSNPRCQSSHCQDIARVPENKLFSFDTMNRFNSDSKRGWNTLRVSYDKKNPFPERETSRQRISQSERRKFSQKKSCCRYKFCVPYSALELFKKQEYSFRNDHRNRARVKERNGKSSKFRKENLRQFNNGIQIRKSKRKRDRTGRLFRNKRKNYTKSTVNNFYYDWVDDESRNFEKQRWGGLTRRKHIQIPLKRSPQTEKDSTICKSNKAKRTKRIWKKLKFKDSYSKPTKDYNGNAYSFEMKNYINNLFRGTTSKPKTIITLDENPVMQVGKVVIDRDSVEDKKMEVLFLDEDNEYKLEKNYQLPRPPLHGDRLSLRGQEVFELVQKLQRRSCLYRQNNDTEDKSNMEVNIKIPQPHTLTATTSDAEADTTKKKPTKEITKNTTPTTQITTQTAHSTHSDSKATRVPESQPQTTVATTAIKPERRTEATTETENDQETTIEKSDPDSNYDIDEIIPYPPGVETPSEEPQEKKKNDKQKKKQKKKKYKGPVLEDYEQELNETTNGKLFSRYYDSREVIRGKKNERKWRE